MSEPTILQHVVVTQAAMVPLAVTLPVAVLAAGGLVMYWRSLRREKVPHSRRRIRSANSVIQLILLTLLVYALSIVDAVHQPAEALLAWTAVALLLLLTIVLALADVYNTWRLHRRIADRLRSAARRRLQSPAQELHTPDESSS